MQVEMFDSSSDARVENNVVRHEYRKLSDEDKADMKLVKDMGLDFITFCDEYPATSDQQRALKLAITKMEEAVMWAVKAITA